MLSAASVGSWGDKLRVRVEHVLPAGGDNDKLWNLTIRDTGTGTQERYLGISTEADSDRTLEKVLRRSALVRYTGPNPAERPAKNADPRADSPNEDMLAGDQFDEDDNPRYYVPADGNLGDDGSAVDATTLRGSEVAKSGIYALLDADIFTILCLPPTEWGKSQDAGVITAAGTLCFQRRSMLLLDPPTTWTDVTAVATDLTTTTGPFALGDTARNAAVYFPNVRIPDPLDPQGDLREFPPCGVIAGLWARTDAERGVWKAPAGTDAGLRGVAELAVTMTDGDNGRLNPFAVNCLRSFPVYGTLSWGARTRVGADRLADQWKYVPVRRLALFIEESLFRGTKWVVFEPNGETLWSSIRLNVGAFMNGLFQKGAFAGTTANEAYLVVCDKTNNPQNTIDQGIVNIRVGFAPLKPAEFVIIQIQQLAGDIAV
ncbi:phage tail sheath family protein [Actinoplanes sp. CA-030573]|uniref:phage tail sheath family protein n=1 Tax=Actinoplanes sp. CA-030573 TaxID=3239898 RepID=UPI003D907E95